MASPSRSASGLRYLFWCANEHLDFRIPEFEAVSRIFDIPLRWEEKNDLKPWLILNLDSDSQAKKILSRSVATKYCIQLWGDGGSFKELHENLKKCNLEELMAPFKDKSFKMEVESFMKKSPLSERLEKIEQFSYLPLSGPVKLKDPDLVLSCLEFYGLDQNNLADHPCRVFFGRFVGEGRRDLVTRLSIKKRRFIGNTTMDPQLSLLMANLACVKEGDLAMDPFVGTGSLSLACAQFGARCLGGDIDFLMLHARLRKSYFI